MGKKRKEQVKQGKWQQFKEDRRTAKDIKMIRSEEDWIYRVKLQCMKEDDQTYKEINECCETHPKYSLMVKYGRSWGRLLADPLHVKRHCDEFQDGLTEEEKPYWDEAFKGKSMFTLYKEFRAQQKEEKSKAKEAKRQAKKQGIKVTDTEYFRDLAEKLSDQMPDDPAMQELEDQEFDSEEDLRACLDELYQKAAEQ